MAKQTFLRGTLILIAAGMITRMLGFVNRVVIARFIGEEGVGLYMMAAPTFFLATTLTQFGLPVAISKLVAEASARGDRQKMKHILVMSLTVTGILSLIFTPLFLCFAPIMSETMLTDQRTVYPLLAITPVVPIIAISSVLRGYFQGRQNMNPLAFSQVLEQIVRISLVAVCTTVFLPYGIEYAAAGAMISSVIGELASLIYLFICFKANKTIRIRKQFFKSIANGKETFRQLMSVSLPTTGSRFIGNLSWFFEPIVVAQSLAIAGVATAAATSQYGELTGFAMTVLTLPSFITYSLSTALVPAISEGMEQKKLQVVEYRLEQAMRLCLLSGGISVVILFSFADELMSVMYGSTNAAVFVKVMAPFFLLYYFQGPLQAVLQALNLAGAAMMNSFIGAAVKTGLIFVLATRPSLGIMGAALAIVTGMVLVTLLHAATVSKVLPISIKIKEYALCFAVIFICGYVSRIIKHAVHFSGSEAVNLTGWIAMTAILYIALLLLFRLIKREELIRIPVIGKFVMR
ncbi:MULTISPECIES: stage V sporulation protein B [Bacillus amyloliquefaciens group]|uniref:stage V sporulation protein B n=1 Tax=Bacillus amyloliquefaciens group TaxID=1938374 RepID=UPI000B4CC65E|nr:MULTISPECIES: stage V sporulation protein B [Bacillus amyloliquefaciens group]MEB4594898.1 stage V sporulation protein B [Bacillus amyloliquefaciens]OWP61227.1 stage V sporulation protein B [Bacillus velezensis]QEQ04258.1 stage V sporulation protein B [Bacillus velezensis]